MLESGQVLLVVDFLGFQAVPFEYHEVFLEALLADPVARLMYLGDLAVYGLAVLAFIPALIYLLRRFHPRRWQGPYTVADWANILLLNPAVWLALLIFAGEFIL